MSPRDSERRPALIQTAVELIAEKGLAACTFRALANAAGTSTAPFTHAFGSRAAMIDAIAETVWHRTGVTPTVDDVDDPLSAIFDACALGVPRPGAEDPYLRAYFEILFHGIRDARVKASMGTHDVACHARYIALIEAAQARGQLSPDLDAAGLLDRLWALTDGLCLAHSGSPGLFTAEHAQRIWRQGFAALTGTPVR